MKKILTHFALFLALSLVSAVVLAQAVPALPSVSYDQLIGNIFGAVGQLKGATPLAVVALVIQALIWFLESPLGAIAGKWTLAIVLLLSVASAEVMGLSSGLSFWASAASGAVLGAFQVLAHQLWNQFVVKSAETSASGK